MSDERTKEDVLSMGGDLLDDGYADCTIDEIPREIMHARFLEHHARSRALYGGQSIEMDTVADLLQGAAKEIRDLYAKLEEAREKASGVP